MKFSIFELLKMILDTGIILALFAAFLEVRKFIKIKRIEIQENHFRTILIYMNIVLNPNINTICQSPKELGILDIAKISIDDTDAIKQYYIDAIKVYKNNLYLYANKKIIDNVDIFIENPSKETYLKTANKMQRYLWKK